MHENVLIESGPKRLTGVELTALQKAILLTVHYRDLFHHPLTLEELQKYLLLVRADARAVKEAVTMLEGTCLSCIGEFITWRGREGIIHERRARLAASARLWAKVRGYTQLLQRIPFIRMAGISGSLAVNHVREDRDDIDVFCITEANRVWIAMFFLKCLYAYSRRNGGHCFVCANTCLGEDQLRISTENLYMAHQIVHVVPLWGREIYARFLRDNCWVGKFLPNAYADCLAAQDPGEGATHHWSERLLPRRLGDQLNQSICVAGVRKAGKFYRTTHTDAMLHNARNPKRYMIPGLGYTGNLYRRFMAGHSSRFTHLVTREEMAATFGCGEDVFVDARLDGMFRWKYESSD